jgi:hypothetical protein
MKKYLAIIAVSALTISCMSDPAKVDDSIVVEQINILEGQTHKYEVKIKTRKESTPVYYYTDYRHQVGDTMAVLAEFFGKKDEEIKLLKFQRDSLRKELDKTKYYLELLNEKAIISSEKQK